MLHKLVLTSAISVILAAPAAVAVAQTSDYPGGPAPQVAGVVVESGESTVDGVDAGRRPSVAATEARRSNGLPVTGVEAVQLALLGVGLVTAGAIVVRRTRRGAGATGPNSAPPEGPPPQC